MEGNKPTHDQLKEAARPLHKLLCEYYHPHAMVILTQISVEIVEGDMTIELESPDCERIACKNRWDNPYTGRIWHECSECMGIVSKKSIICKHCFSKFLKIEEINSIMKSLVVKHESYER